jgi:general secretion pathway protein D
MVLDNEKAEIKVGDRISVQTQSQTGVSTGTGVLNSYQYLETGILLAVTPRINSGGLVTLEINQEVSEVDRSSITANNPNPDVITRNAKTSVVVASGESIALGGLIRDIKNYGSSGIPLLSKIPIIGAAFGVQTFSRRRTELVMLITPRIVSDPSQARDATQELRQKLPALRNLLPPMSTSIAPAGAPLVEPDAMAPPFNGAQLPPLPPGALQPAPAPVLVTPSPAPPPPVPAGTPQALPPPPSTPSEPPK